MIPNIPVLAIDSYCFLHKGVYSCAYQLVQGQKTTRHIDYCMKYVNLLLSFNIKPILVFDGQDLPAKRETNSKRREQRNLAKSRASELLRLGKTEEARKHLNSAVDVTHQMAHELMVECRKKNVDCIVAPYESDSELCYLNIKGIADVVVSEDSDLTLFGCKKVLFKLALDGSCLLFDADKLHLAMNCPKEKFSFDKFRIMAVLSGCDYLSSLPGIGLAKSLKFVNMTEETDMKKALKKIPSYLNMRKIEVSDEYIENFQKAIATFKYMFVFDPISRKMVRLNELDIDGDEIQYCENAGILLDDKTAFQMALGNIDPHNLSKVLDNFDPDRFQAVKDKSGKSFCNFPSIWKRSGYSREIIEVQDVKRSPLLPRPSQTTQKMEAELFEVYKKENEVETFDENEILMQYASPVQQQPKRLKTTHDTPSRSNVNPFFKSDFDKEGSRKLGDMSLIKQTKFSFKKTVVDESHKVLSRFFRSSSLKVQEEKEEKEEASGGWISSLRKQYECTVAEKKLVLSKDDKEKLRSQKSQEEQEMMDDCRENPGSNADYSDFMEIIDDSQDSPEKNCPIYEGSQDDFQKFQENLKSSQEHEAFQEFLPTDLKALEKLPTDPEGKEDPPNLHQLYRTPEQIHSEPSDQDYSPKPSRSTSNSDLEAYCDSQRSDANCEIQKLAISEAPSIDLDTYEFKSNFLKAKSAAKPISTSTNVRKTGCRKPGLARPKSSSSSVQMKLSSFGFQKKPSL